MPLLTDVYSIESIKFIGQLVGAFLLIVWVLLRTKSIAPLHLMLMKSPLNVCFFKSDSGNEPVRDWLKSLSPQDRRVLGEDIKTVQFGWPLGMPLERQLWRHLGN